MLKTSVVPALCACLIAAAAALPVRAADDAVMARGGGGGRATVTCYAASAQENEAAVRATNATRRARGLPALRANGDLALAAARHACDMARRSALSHRGSKTRGPLQRLRLTGYRPGLTAENIGAGPWGLDRVLQEWVRSRGHLANILIPQIRHYGIGKAVAADGRTVFWAAVYSAPKSR